MQQTAHKVVVIGHRNPDTDSICSAIAYAELKNKTSDLVCEARRAGKMNQETEFVLKKFGVTPPRMCTDVNPKIRDVDYREMPGISGSTSTIFSMHITPVAVASDCFLKIRSSSIVRQTGGKINRKNC